MLKSMQNPQAMLGQMMKNNPNYQEVMNIVNEFGGDAKAAFYKMADEKGVNPDEILNMLR